MVMKKKMILQGFIFTCIHFALVFVSLMLAYHNIDDPSPYTISQQIFLFLGTILVLPGSLLLSFWLGENSAALEWLLSILNSLLWGFSLSLAVQGWVKFRSRKSST